MLERLAEFATENRFRGKGPLSVALVVTDHAKNLGLPLNPTALVPEGGGQVLGLGNAKVQAILARHNIVRTLAREAGRTSRGSIRNMEKYVTFLNQEAEEDGNLDLDQIETFWVDQVRAFFASKPFSLRLDGTLGLRAVVRNLMAQAEERQKEMPGTMVLGTMMQHMVGAKLDLLLGTGVVEQHGSNENDEGEGRTGDFDTGDVSIHVSTAPSEALIRKCAANLDVARKPIIVTTKKGTIVAEGLAENAGIGERVDIVEFEQFIATNIYELGRFVPEQRSLKITELLQCYNSIVDAHETDPSLRIELARGR
jgi:hypothetical protein